MFFCFHVAVSEAKRCSRAPFRLQKGGKTMMRWPWWLPVAFAVDVSLRPTCKTHGTSLPIAGYVSQNNLVLDAGAICI